MKCKAHSARWASCAAAGTSSAASTASSVNTGFSVITGYSIITENSVNTIDITVINTGDNSNNIIVFTDIIIVFSEKAATNKSWIS